MDKKPKNQDQIAASQIPAGDEAKTVDVSKKPQDVAIANPELPDSPNKDKKEPNNISVSTQLKSQNMAVYLVIENFLFNLFKYALI